MLESTTRRLRDELAYHVATRATKVMITGQDAALLVQLLTHAMEAQWTLDSLIEITKMTPGEPERFL